MLSGCATIFTSDQNINLKVVDSVTQSDLTNFTCLLTDGSGNQITFKTSPSVIALSKGHNGIIVNCKKVGYHQLNMAVGENFNVVTVVNLLFWPGFIVDAATGAYKKYPSHYIVNMEKG
ncbi:MAG: hypothetical protein KBD64_03435 [Gammaproteobacteria bacterium]|nr:hypothetical protein [Gammaproteobacteria bacterium]